MMLLLLQFIDFKARPQNKFLRLLLGLASLPTQCHERSKVLRKSAILRLQRRLAHLLRIVKRTCWSDYVSRVDLSLSFFIISQKKDGNIGKVLIILHHLTKFSTHSWKRLKICYESLRNIAMHFKEVKSVENAFYSSAAVTRASQAPVFSRACFSRVRL